MTFRSRLMFGLLTVLVVLAVAPSSFAQINIQLFNAPSAAEIQTNRNAQTADPGVSGAGILVSGALIANSALTTTTLRIAYPSPITSAPNAGPSSPSNLGIPSGGDAIRIEGASGLFASVATPVLNTTFSRVEITLPGFDTAANSLSGSFTLVGVRIDANGKTGAQTATASLNSSANNYVLTTPSITVINALSPGIANFAIGARSSNSTLGAATIFTNRTVPDPTGSLILAEGFAGAFRTSAQLSNFGGGPVKNSTQIRLTFNGIPAGVTLSLDIKTRSGTGELLVPSSMVASFSASGPATSATTTTTVTASANTATISFLQASLATTDTVEVDYTVLTPLSTTAAVTTASTITCTATLVPIGDGVDNSDSTRLGLPREDQGYPTFAEADLGPITVVNIIPASTTMLLPYALVLPPYDTGLAVANTTADPFGSSGGGATSQSGNVVLTFYPTLSAGGAGTSFSLTTSSTVRPGAGLSSDGTIAAGATWTVLLSQLLTAAGQTGNFVGYVFIQANFLNAHGTATISDFRTYSLAANVLVLPPPATIARTVGTESLGN